jgi:hypothetical protein
MASRPPKAFISYNKARRTECHGIDPPARMVFERADLFPGLAQALAAGMFTQLRDCGHREAARLLCAASY